MLPEKIYLAVEWFCDTKKTAAKREKYLHDWLDDCRIEDLQAVSGTRLTRKRFAKKPRR